MAKLILVWAALLALTLLSMGTGAQDGSAARLSLGAAAVVLAAALVKAVGILHAYLGLTARSGGWRGGFIAGLLLLLLALWAGHAISV